MPIYGMMFCTYYYFAVKISEIAYAKYAIFYA